MKKKYKNAVIVVIITIIVLVVAQWLTSQGNINSGDNDGHLSVNAQLKDYPLVTPVDRIPLTYIEKDGFKEFHLTVDEIRWEFSNGKFVHAWGYNGQIPGPEIRVNEGDKLRIVVKNNLPYEKGTTIHWHGVRLENAADGIPGLTQQPIKPGETYIYEYTARNAGTHFYHSHGSSHTDVAMQDDMGLTGPLIVEPKNKSDARHSSNYDREYVFMLDEWAVDHSGKNQAVNMVSDSGEHAHGEGSGHDYNIFTINGRTFPDTETLLVKEGEKVLVRLINSGSKEIHPMHTHGHGFELIAVDGNLVPDAARQTMDVITLHPGERRDIVIMADNPGVWLFHCHDTHHAAGGMIMPFFYEGYDVLV